MIYNPLFNRVVVERDDNATKTESGFLLNTSKKELPPHGTVVATGPDVKYLKIGDQVLFNQYGAIPLEADQTNQTKGLLILLESQCHSTYE